jgi:hypothetical protein
MGQLPSRAVLPIALSLGLSACSLISQSVESVSESVSKGLGSVSDSFGSISGSSSGGGGGTASTGERYRADLCAFVQTRLSQAEQDGEQAGAGDDFVREVGRIAERHGITEWEGDPNTARALREAIATGGIGPDGVARLRRDLAPLGAPWLDGALAPPAAGAGGDGR